MEFLYFIAKVLAATVCVSSALLLLYLSFKARMFLVSLQELEVLVKEDLRKLLLATSLGLTTTLGFIFKSSKAKSPFSLLASIIGLLRNRRFR